MAPVFFRITSGRKKFVPGPFSLGRWAVSVGTIACLWVTFITTLLVFPPESGPNSQDMSEFLLNLGLTTMIHVYQDYAVVIIGGIFVFAGGWWIISAHKWFSGPVVSIDTPPKNSGTVNDSVLK